MKTESELLVEYCEAMKWPLSDHVKRSFGFRGFVLNYHLAQFRNSVYNSLPTFIKRKIGMRIADNR